MGWSFYHRPKGESDRDHLQRELGGDHLTILDSVTIRNTFYAAARIETGSDAGDVIGLVVLQQRVRGEHNYGYKAMDETMGPNEDYAPARILDLLSPIDSQYANEWRARCRANAAAKAAKPKVRPGDVVEFAEPIEFSNGAQLKRFVYGKSTLFTKEGSSQRYRIPRWRERQYTVHGAA